MAEETTPGCLVQQQHPPNGAMSLIKGGIICQLQGFGTHREWVRLARSPTKTPRKKNPQLPLDTAEATIGSRRRDLLQNYGRGLLKSAARIFETGWAATPLVCCCRRLPDAAGVKMDYFLELLALYR